MASTVAGPSSRAARPPPEPLPGGPAPSSLRTRVAAAMASTAAGGDAARDGGLNPPHPNPSGDGAGPKLLSPPGKGNKPVALVDITNTGRPKARSISVPDLVKENAQLRSLLTEKTKIIDLSRTEFYKLRLALQASKQQNLQLVQNNSQMLVEINAGRDRIKILQHEISCAKALLKVKDSELDRNKNAAKGQQKGVKSQVLMKGTASIVTGVEAVTSGVEHHLVESHSAVSSNTACQEPPLDGKQKRMPQRRKSSRLNQGSCEISGVSQNTLLEDTVAPLPPSTLSVEHHLVESQSAVSSNTDCQVPSQDGIQKRIPQRRKSSRLNQGSCEISGVSQNTLLEDTVAPLPPSTLSVEHHLVESQSAVSSNTDCQEPSQDGIQKRMPPRRRSSRHQGSSEIGAVSQNTLHEDIVAPLAPSTCVQNQYEQTTEQYMEKSLQNECSATLHEVVMASGLNETEINFQTQEANLKEIQEACSREAGVQSHKIGGEAFNSKQNHLIGSESSLSFNTVEPPEPPEDKAMKRCSKKRSAVEDVNAKLDMTTHEPLRHEEKRKSQRRKSSRLNSVSSEDKDTTVETEHKDVIAPLAGSGSNASRTNQKQNDDCSLRKSNGDQIPGRRSLRRAAEKVVSYKEIPLNVKMRRP